MYFSAGDGSGVLEPSIDPDAIAVGGTTLGIGKSGNRLFETGWSVGASVIKNGQWVLTGEDGASGGGPSVQWAQPAYQAGVVPSSLGSTRSAPDISAAADPFTGMALGQLSFSGRGARPRYSQIPIGGTSESSPLVAGMVTAAQQGQSATFGFINPAIYALAGTNAFFPTLPLTSSSPALDRGLVCDVAEFAHICGRPTSMTLATFDDQDPQMRGYTGQVTLPGYDNMTGLGTPDGPISSQISANWSASCSPESLRTRRLDLTRSAGHHFRCSGRLHQARIFSLARSNSASLMTPLDRRSASLFSSSAVLVGAACWTHDRNAWSWA